MKRRVLYFFSGVTLYLGFQTQPFSALLVIVVNDRRSRFAQTDPRGRSFRFSFRPISGIVIGPPTRFTPFQIDPAIPRKRPEIGGAHQGIMRSSGGRIAGQFGRRNCHRAQEVFFVTSFAKIDDIFLRSGNSNQNGVAYVYDANIPRNSASTSTEHASKRQNAKENFHFHLTTSLFIDPLIGRRSAKMSPPPNRGDIRFRANADYPRSQVSALISRRAM